VCQRGFQETPTLKQLVASKAHGGQCVAVDLFADIKSHQSTLAITAVDLGSVHNTLLLPKLLWSRYSNRALSENTLIKQSLDEPCILDFPLDTPF